MLIYSLSIRLERGFEDIIEAVIESGVLNILGFNTEFPIKEESISIVNIYNENEEILKNNLNIIEENIKGIAEYTYKIEELKSMYIETQDLIMRTYFEKQYKLIETEEDVQKLSAKLDKYVELTGKVKVNDYYYNNSENYKSNFMNKLDLKLIKLHEQRSKMALTVVYGSRINKLINKIKALFKLNT